MHSDCILLFPQQPSFTLPWGFLSDLANGVTDLRLGKSFLGCLENFRFNHVHVQLTQFAKTFFWWTWFWNQPDYVEVQPPNVENVALQIDWLQLQQSKDIWKLICFVPGWTAANWGSERGDWRTGGKMDPLQHHRLRLLPLGEKRTPSASPVHREFGRSSYVEESVEWSGRCRRSG